MSKQNLNSIIRKKRFKKYSIVIDILTKEIDKLFKTIKESKLIIQERDEKLFTLLDIREEFLYNLGFESLLEYEEYKRLNE